MDFGLTERLIALVSQPVLLIQEMLSGLGHEVSQASRSWAFIGATLTIVLTLAFASLFLMHRAWKERRNALCPMYLILSLCYFVGGLTLLLSKVAPNHFSTGWSRVIAAVICVVSAAVVMPLLPKAHEREFIRRQSAGEKTQSLEDAKNALEKELQEKKRIEAELRKSENRFRTLVDSNIVGVMISSLDGRLVEANDAYLDMLGYSSAEFLENPPRWDTLTSLDSLDKDHSAIAEVRARGACTPYEKVYLHRSGRRVPILIAYARLEEDDNSVIGYTVDLTPIKRMEAELRIAQERLQRTKDDLEVRINERTHALSKALQEKEMLLKEIHHRVKNNLNVVSSLLSLQARQMNDERFRAALQESRDRINSITTIHEKLYQSEDLASICFRDYLQDLIKNLRTNYDADGREISMHLDVDSLFLGIDTAIPCGLIINELITNSLKYAFAEGKGGEIVIRLREIFPSELELMVRDDGRGIPDNLDFQSTSSLGLRLVTMLTRQLGGTLDISSESGTRFLFRFPSNPPILQSRSTV